MLLTQGQKNTIHALEREGADVTVSDLSDMGSSFPTLIELLRTVWCTNEDGEINKTRLTEVRVGTMYLIHEDGNANLTIKLRFPLEEQP